MHPAYSVILFTTASGAGYGLLILLSVYGLLGLVATERWLGFTGFGVAFALVTAGLLASTFHLGHPERAWRAFSQWRSSWLSREGVLAAATYLPAGLFALAWVLFETTGALWAIAGWIGILGAIATVCCTGMIYASLKTIRQWHNPWVVPVYMLLALTTGAVCLNVLLAVFGAGFTGASWVAIAGLALALVAKLAYWASIDNARKTYTAEQATGLGRFGPVRPLDPPHSQANFVMREMGYSVARRHARKLRMLAVLTGFVVPALATAAMLTMPGIGDIVFSVIALLSAAIGVAIERWLFFAEAQHVVTLYYGAQRA